MITRCDSRWISCASSSHWGTLSLMCLSQLQDFYLKYKIIIFKKYFNLTLSTWEIKHGGCHLSTTWTRERTSWSTKPSLLMAKLLTCLVFSSKHNQSLLDLFLQAVKSRGGGEGQGLCLLLKCIHLYHQEWPWSWGSKPQKTSLEDHKNQR